MTKLKTIMVMNEAKGLLLDLLATHYYVEERKNCMLRCVKDLSDCVKESDENVTQEGLCNIDDMQAEINRLRDLLKQCIPAAEFAKDKGLADMINKALNGESSKF